MVETKSVKNVGFLEAITNKQVRKARTENGARTLSTSGQKVADLFFAIGNVRKNTTEQNMKLFLSAFNEDHEKALKVLFYARDVRGGQGERKFFRDALKEILVGNEIVLTFSGEDRPRTIHNLLLDLCAEYGRFDDYFDVMEEILADKNNSGKIMFMDAEIFDWIKDYVSITEDKKLVGNNELLFKWLPRKGLYTNRLRKFLGMDRKSYRKLLVTSTETVEQKITRKEYDLIEFKKLPSLAMKRHTKFFNKTLTERFNAYKEALAKGETKINASTLYPYDVVSYLKRGETSLANATWKALPNYFESTKNILPVIDVSGSMETPAGTSGIRAIDVAISLGMYLSEHIKGYFNNSFITFDAVPRLLKMKSDTFSHNYNDVKMSPWGGNTDLVRTFELVLNATLESNDVNSVPEAIIIISDMEFDEATSGNKKTNFEKIDKMYRKAGVKRPNLIFWNVCRRTSENFPVTSDEEGTIMLGGFSPSIMKYLIDIIDGKEINSNSLIDLVVNSERYQKVEELLPFINNKK